MTPLRISEGAVAKTLDDLVNESRLMLKDRRQPYRYTQDDLLDTINSTLREVKRLRPDAFVAYGDYRFSPIPLPDYQIADLGKDPLTPLPIDEIFFLSVVFHVVGKLQLGDDEFAVDNRAMSLLAAFRQQLVGSGG